MKSEKGAGKMDGIILLNKEKDISSFKAINNLKYKLKLKKETETIDNHYAVAARDNPHLQLERKNTEQTLKHIIGTLPQLQQQIITMKDVEEYEIDEIAEITGTSAEAVRVNLSRARKKVREEYIKLTQR